MDTPTKTKITLELGRFQEAVSSLLAPSMAPFQFSGIYTLSDLSFKFQAASLPVDLPGRSMQDDESRPKSSMIIQATKKFTHVDKIHESVPCSCKLKSVHL